MLCLTTHLYLQKRQRFAQTWRGKVYNLIGLVFAFYCLARVLMVSLRSRPSAAATLELTSTPRAVPHVGVIPAVGYESHLSASKKRRHPPSRRQGQHERRLDIVFDRTCAQPIAHGRCRRQDVESSHLAVAHGPFDPGVFGSGITECGENLEIDEQEHRSWILIARPESAHGQFRHHAVA
jgi:hypothetical protein